MANERISVRKIKEVLRHRLTLGLSRAQTARALGIGRTTVGEYEGRFKSSGLTFPLPEDLNDAVLDERLFPKSAPAGTRQAPPLEYLAKEMKRPNVTLALLWEEYKKAHPYIGVLDKIRGELAAKSKSDPKINLTFIDNWLNKIKNLWEDRECEDLFKE